VFDENSNIFSIYFLELFVAFISKLNYKMGIHAFNAALVRTNFLTYYKSKSYIKNNNNINNNIKG
jgi:hypothetical protein